VQKTQTLYKKKKEKKTIKQTYNTITRNRKNKKTNIRQVIPTYKTIR
jgi:hypothetical protein